jgi:hypothetical protein
MSAEDEGGGQDPVPDPLAAMDPATSEVGTPPGIPEGMFLALPQPKTPGEVIPPIPVEFSVGLTDKDVHGHRWVVFQAADGTVSVSFRVPWQMAPQIGMQIANGLSAMAQKAAAEENGGLVVPGRPAGGGLFVARPGATPNTAGVPPLNGFPR